MNLPKLPEPFKKQGQQMSYDGNDKVFFDCYTITQMQDYGELHRQHALDKAIELVQFLRYNSVDYIIDSLTKLKG